MKEILLSMFPVNGKKEEENIFHMDILLAIMQVLVTHMKHAIKMCAKYDINIMGMIIEASQNDQKKKPQRSGHSEIPLSLARTHSRKRLLFYEFPRWTIFFPEKL